MAGPDLSIVLPALNERGKVAGDVLAAAEFLLGQGLSGEVIVVDDGSTDGTAAAAEGAPVPPGVDLRVIRHERNHGKGRAVRTGVLASRGEHVLFADCGLCVPFADALPGLDLIRSGRCEIAHGSRWHRASLVVRRRGLYRRAVSRLGRRLARCLAGTPARLTDTQCGFKVYRGEVARELYAECACDGYLFDVDITLRALRRGCQIEEFPVHWRADPDSRFRPLRCAPRLLGELIAMRRALRKTPQGQ